MCAVSRLVSTRIPTPTPGVGTSADAARIGKRRRTTRVRRIEAQKFRITHPFHPLTGREFEALAQKEHGGERRVSFLDRKGRQCEIPLEWTDLAPEDAITVLAAGKSCFRAADLLELARLVAALLQ
jgi:hypothetical protein